MHHAEHLATVRKRSGSQPLTLLKEYTDAMKAAGSRRNADILSAYDVKSDRRTSLSKNVTGNRNVNNNNLSGGKIEHIDKFDDIDGVQRDGDGNGDGGGGAGAGSSFWSAIGLGGRKTSLEYK